MLISKELLCQTTFLLEMDKGSSLLLTLMIIAAVSNDYQIRQRDLYKSKRGEFNEARNAAVFYFEGCGMIV